MREVAEQLGADGAYLFRTDVRQAIVLAPWAIVDGAIQHRDTLPALEPLMRASAIEAPAAPKVERYTLRHHQHPYLGSTRLALFRQQGYRVGLTLPLLAGGQTLGFLECLARDEMAFLPAQIEQARALAEQVCLSVQCARMIEHAARAAAFEERQRLAREIHDTVGQAFTAILVQLRSAEETLGDVPDPTRGNWAGTRARARRPGGGPPCSRRPPPTAARSLRPRDGAAPRGGAGHAGDANGCPMHVRGDACALPIDTPHSCCGSPRRRCPTPSNMLTRDT